MLVAAIDGETQIAPRVSAFQIQREGLRLTWTDQYETIQLVLLVHQIHKLDIRGTDSAQRVQPGICAIHEKAAIRQMRIDAELVIQNLWTQKRLVLIEDIHTRPELQRIVLHGRAINRP